MPQLVEVTLVSRTFNQFGITRKLAKKMEEMRRMQKGISMPKTLIFSQVAPMGNSFAYTPEEFMEKYK